jgi:hypothetical protein
MTFNYDAQRELPLVGGLVQAQRLFVPAVVVDRLGSYRHACRLAWKLRVNKRLTKRELAEQAGLYYSHVTDYFSQAENRRELPARCVGAVERVLGNAVISQWQARDANVTLLEEMQATRRAA